MDSQNLSNSVKYRLMCCDLVGTHIFSGWDSGSDLSLPYHPSPPVSSSNSLNIGENKIFRKRVLGLNLSLDDLSSPNLGVQFWHRQELNET